MTNKDYPCDECIHSDVCDYVGILEDDEKCENRIPTTMTNRGYWIKNKVAFYWECSVCGVDIRNHTAEIFLENGALNFCPCCGADMREVIKNESNK